MEIQLSNFYKYFIVIVSIITLGIAFPLFWFDMRNWPKYIDAEYIKTRGGKIFLWDQLTSYKKTVYTSNNRKGIVIAQYHDFFFDDVRVRINTTSLAQGKEVVAYVLNILEHRKSRGLYVE